jgi:hypothetical protein
VALPPPEVPFGHFTVFTAPTVRPLEVPIFGKGQTGRPGENIFITFTKYTNKINYTYFIASGLSVRHE